MDVQLHSCSKGETKRNTKRNTKIDGHQVTFNSKRVGLSEELVVIKKSTNVLTPEAVFDGVSSFSLHCIMESSLVVVLSAQSALARQIVIILVERKS